MNYIANFYISLRSLSKYLVYSKTQLILMSVSFFYKLHHPLQHGPITNTTWSVPIMHYCLPYPQCHPCKRSKDAL